MSSSSLDPSLSPPDGPQRLDPRSITVGRAGGWIFVLVMAGFTLPALLVGLIAGPRWEMLIALPPVLVLLGLVATLATIGPVWRYRYTWYRVDGDGIEIGRGRVWQRLITIPHARVQHVDIVRGPIERKFGLATLIIFTAGRQNAEIKIEGLSHEAALGLRERLVRERGLDAI